MSLTQLKKVRDTLDPQNNLTNGMENIDCIDIKEHDLVSSSQKVVLKSSATHNV